MNKHVKSMGKQSPQERLGYSQRPVKSQPLGVAPCAKGWVAAPCWAPRAWGKSPSRAHWPSRDAAALMRTPSLGVESWTYHELEGFLTKSLRVLRISRELGLKMISQISEESGRSFLMALLPHLQNRMIISFFPFPQKRFCRLCWPFEEANFWMNHS